MDKVSMGDFEDCGDPPLVMGRVYGARICIEGLINKVCPGAITLTAGMKISISSKGKRGKPRPCIMMAEGVSYNIGMCPVCPLSSFGGKLIDSVDCFPGVGKHVLHDTWVPVEPCTHTSMRTPITIQPELHKNSYASLIEAQVEPKYVDEFKNCYNVTQMDVQLLLGYVFDVRRRGSGTVQGGGGSSSKEGGRGSSSKEGGGGSSSKEGGGGSLSKEGGRGSSSKEEGGGNSSKEGGGGSSSKGGGGLSGSVSSGSGNPQDDDGDSDWSLDFEDEALIDDMDVDWSCGPGNENPFSGLCVELTEDLEDLDWSWDGQGPWLSIQAEEIIEFLISNYKLGLIDKSVLACMYTYLSST